MKSLLIIPAMSNGNKIQNCMKSISESDYDGRSVVISPVNIDSVSDYGLGFLSTNGSIYPADRYLYEATMSIDSPLDLIIYAHSDTILPKNWYSSLVATWDSVDPSRVGCICLPYFK